MELSVVKGLCSSMCPDSEVKLRERENLLHPFETVAGPKCQRPTADYKKCVKEYRRPTVGKQEVDPYDIRPPDLLVATADYLIDSIATRRVPWNEIYDFMFDRLRSVRQDLVIQDLHGYATIQILEKAIRFYIISDYSFCYQNFTQYSAPLNFPTYPSSKQWSKNESCCNEYHQSSKRLCTEDISLFDQKINNQHIQECLKRLINCYEKQSTSQNESRNQRSSATGDENNQHGCLHNRAEFEATYLLFNLGEADALKHFYSLGKKLRNNPILKAAYEISVACILHNWVRMFRLVKKLTLPIHLCTVTRHFPELQCSKNSRYPLDKLRQLLLLNTDTECQKLCENHGLQLTGTNVNFFKTSFVNQVKISRTQCDYVTHRLREWSIQDILHGHIEKDDKQFNTDSELLVSDLTEKCSI